MPETSTPSEAARTRARPAARTAAQPTTWQGRFWREVRGYAEALAIAYLVVTFVFTTVGVIGSSMEPNLDGGVGRGNLIRSLLTGDRVFIPKYDTWLRRAGVLGEYERGAVVVLREPANAPTALETGRRSFYIKRVIGQPGDRVRMSNPSTTRIMKLSIIAAVCGKRCASSAANCQASSCAWLKPSGRPQRRASHWS